MTTQEVLVALCAMAALAYVGRGVWKTMAGGACKTGCGTGCGTKPAAPVGALTTVDDLTARVRKNS